MSSRTLRVACVQLEPAFRDVQTSIARADGLLKTIEPASVDLIILPELAFSGYCFTSREDIEPFLEDAASGRTFHWASEVAARLQCYVMVGVATTAPMVPSPARPTSNGSNTSAPAFNSVLLLDPEGDLLHTYHKHHLYETDESWATEGPSFTTWELPFPSGSAERGSFSLCPCICMDLNPKGFIAPFEAYELASFAKQASADVVVCSMAWLESEPPSVDELQETQGDIREEWGKVQSTISYWAARCMPLIGSGTAFVGCNRVGREGETFFTGSSCVMVFHEMPEVLEHAPKRGEALLFVDVPLKARG